MNIKKRHKIEREFHDKWASTIEEKDVNYVGAFEAVTAVENRFALKQMVEIEGKRILDLGCGMGDASLYFASKGAVVDAIDISPGMIKLVRKLCRKNGFRRRVNAKVMIAENLNFPKESFDFVFGNGVLHHVEISKALEEVHRVLKPGGVATFIEPLEHNPIINIYRRIAKDVRTPTEIPIDYKRIERLTEAKFSKSLHKEFHFSTLLIFLWFYVFENSDPNKERYWKKIINEANRVSRVFSILNSFDSYVGKAFPDLRKYYWNTVIVYEK